MFRVPGLGLRVYGLWFRVWGLGFRVWGLGFRVWGLGAVSVEGLRVSGLAVFQSVVFMPRFGLRA